MAQEPIKIKASLWGVRTSQDGGFRVSLDIPETDLVGVMSLMGLRGEVLNLEILPEGKE